MQVGSLVELQTEINGGELECTFIPYGTVLPKGTIATIGAIHGRNSLEMEDIQIISKVECIWGPFFSAEYWRELQPPMEVDISEIQHTPLKIKELV